MTLTEYLTELGLYTPPPKPEPALPSFLRDFSSPGTEIKIVIDGDSCIEATGILRNIDTTQSCKLFAMNTSDSTYDGSLINQMTQSPIVDISFMLREVQVVGR